MKSFMKVGLIALMVISLSAASALAFDKRTDDRKKGDKEDSRTRALLVKVDKGEVDGLRIKILKSENETLTPVDPAKDFKSGDKIRVAFESNFDGFVYIINVTPGGKTKVLFPYKHEGNNMVSKGQRYEFPGEGLIEFDNEVGTEVLQVYMSRERIKSFDEAIKNPNGEMGTSAASAASELAGNKTPIPPAVPEQSGVIADNTNSVLPSEGEGAVRTRKIRLAPGKDQEKVAIPENNGTPTKMKSGEVALFEIRLKHI
jgi:hypothetical protein